MYRLWQTNFDVGVVRGDWKPRVHKLLVVRERCGASVVEELASAPPLPFVTSGFRGCQASDELATGVLPRLGCVDICAKIFVEVCDVFRPVKNLHTSLLSNKIRRIALIDCPKLSTNRFYCDRSYSPIVIIGSIVVEKRFSAIKIDSWKKFFDNE